MKTAIHLNNEKIIAGITLKDSHEFENNNMALHACKSQEHIIKNRQKLAVFLNCELESFVCSEQTHRTNFHKVSLADKGRGAISIANAIRNTDALYTYEPNVLLCIFTADCVPVVFYNTATNLIGVIHSGWQGTVRGITLKVFEQLIHHEHCNPNDLQVHLGPALSQERFEVDEDVYVKFKNLGYAEPFIYFKQETNKFHIDNRLTVKKQCELAGVPSKNISVDQTCTFLSEDHFSYREDKQTGRHLNFIMRKL